MTDPLDYRSADVTDSFDRWAQAVQAQTAARQRAYSDSWVQELFSHLGALYANTWGSGEFQRTETRRGYIDGEWFETTEAEPPQHALPAAPEVTE